MREDSIRGSLKAGKLADITVIDRNIVDHPDELLDLEIEMTIVDGKVVFERS
jgi:predicted amidohydrolase YtcJ